MSAWQAGSADGREASLEQVLYQVKRVIVGQDVLLERMVVALLARGHLLVEGVPGLAKTLAVRSFADALGIDFQRIQFTPDLVPADIVGTRIYNQKARPVRGVARPDLRQSGSGRRDQPGAGQGPERAAGGDAGAPGHHRPGNPPLARSLPGHGYPEPDRIRRDLPAPRGPGRPVHAQGAGRLPDHDRGVRHRRADDRRPGTGAGGHGRPSAEGSPEGGPVRLRRSGAHRILRQGGDGDQDAVAGRPA